jgi:hypothetical protein
MTKLGFNREFRLKQYHKIDHCTKMYLAFLLRMAVANFSPARHLALPISAPETNKRVAGKKNLKFYRNRWRKKSKSNQFSRNSIGTAD